jgi:hypothetical protein
MVEASVHVMERGSIDEADREIASGAKFSFLAVWSCCSALLPRESKTRCDKKKPKEYLRARKNNFLFVKLDFCLLLLPHSRE